MADLIRQEEFKKVLREEPLRTKLLKYADKHGITGNTYCRYENEQEKEDFKLMETYDRIAAKKIFLQICENFWNYDLESHIDGYFSSGDTINNVEIKARFYDLTSGSRKWAWCVDAGKYSDMVAEEAWLLYLWINRDNPFAFDWALWNTTEVEPEDVPMNCEKSFALQGAGKKTNVQKGWYLKDAIISGHTE